MVFGVLDLDLRLTGSAQGAVCTLHKLVFRQYRTTSNGPHQCQRISLLCHGTQAIISSSSLGQSRNSDTNQQPHINAGVQIPSFTGKFYTCPFHFLKNALFTSPESFFFWPNDYFSHHFPRRVLNGILHFLQHSKSSMGNLENIGISADIRQISKSLVLQRLKSEIQLLSPCLSLLSITLL